MKLEVWNGHTIRFVEKDGEWWAVLKDVCEALGLSTRFVVRRLRKDVFSKHPLETNGGIQEMLMVNEFGIYDTVFQSRKKEAEEFRYWVYSMLKLLRESSGLEGFQLFRILDKEHQKEMMKNLSGGLKKPVRVDFIKCNTIANKAISSKHGHPKMVKKGDMSPEMLTEREAVLEDTVELMKANDKFDLGLSVSTKIYEKYHQQKGRKESGR